MTCNHGKTADLTDLLNTLIDAFHKEGKPSNVSTKQAANHRVISPNTRTTENRVEIKCNRSS